jgi:hypothetical protein
MSLFREIEKSIDRVSLFDLRSYLDKAGWRNSSTSGKKWQIYKQENENFGSLELVIPTRDNFLDSRSRIRQTLKSLSELEGRELSEILSDIIGLNTDSVLIKLQISNSSTTIPIESAPRHIKAIRNLIVYSACSEISAKPHYEQPLPSYIELISNFEFCHTFNGSFGFEISSAVARPAQTNDLFDPPKQRKIVERIARGLILLEDSVRNDNPEVMIESYESSFNSRMCDAITDISLNGEVKFSLGVEWASSISPADDVKGFQDIFIGEVEVSVLRHVSEQLKRVKPQAERITGFVVNLHCSNNPIDNNSRRTVALRVAHPDYGSIEVKMDLGPNLYLLAIDAHTKGKRLCVHGQLQRKGNSWSIDAITSVEVVDV